MRSFHMVIFSRNIEFFFSRSKNKKESYECNLKIRFYDVCSHQSYEIDVISNIK